MNKSLFVLGFCIVLFGIYFVWLGFLGYKTRINSEWIKLYTIKGGYRAWTISYSDGLTWDNTGKMINLWRWPKIHHCDARPFLRGDK